MRVLVTRIYVFFLTEENVAPRDKPGGDEREKRLRLFQRR